MHKTISKSDIIFALVQYNSSMLSFLHCCYFAAKLVVKSNFLISNQFLMQKIRFSNFENNEYDVMIEGDVIDIIFHVMSDANDVIKVEIM